MTPPRPRRRRLDAASGVPRRLSPPDAAGQARERHARRTRAAARGVDFLAGLARRGELPARAAALTLRWLPVHSAHRRRLLVEALGREPAETASMSRATISAAEATHRSLALIARWRAGLSSRRDLSAAAHDLARRVGLGSGSLSMRHGFHPAADPIAAITVIHALLLAARLGSAADPPSRWREQLDEEVGVLATALAANDAFAEASHDGERSLAYASDLWRDNVPWATALKPALESALRCRCIDGKMELPAGSAERLAAAIIAADNLRPREPFPMARALASLLAGQGADGGWPATAGTAPGDRVAATVLAVRALVGPARSSGRRIS